MKLRHCLVGIVCVLVFSFGVAQPVSALSADEIQAKVRSLLQQIAGLSAQLNELRVQWAASTSVPVVNPAPPIEVPAPHRVCTILARNLTQGSQGDDVRGLQEFLSEQGYLSGSATGYYGALTADAVAKWQSSQGVSAVGIVGPMSRERIKLWCGGTMCTQEYGPVCGLKPIVCIKAPCNPVPTTYGNRCMMQADGATFSYGGECRPADTCAPRPACLDNPLGACNMMEPARGWCPKKCTPRPACLDARPGCQPPEPIEGWCPVGNQPPVISSFSGPTTLSVNEQGTWTIGASDPENGTLSYDITWGDEGRAVPVTGMSAAREAFVQTTRFAHAYAMAGTYTVSIVVRDASGQEAKTSSTVKVGNTPVACALRYDPVCGRPQECGNPCPAGQYCAMYCMRQIAQTYSNRCFLDAAQAEFIRAGMCTSADY